MAAVVLIESSLLAALVLALLLIFAEWLLSPLPLVIREVRVIILGSADKSLAFGLLTAVAIASTSFDDLDLAWKLRACLAEVWDRLAAVNAIEARGLSPKLPFFCCLLLKSLNSVRKSGWSFVLCTMSAWWFSKVIWHLVQETAKLGCWS